MRFPNPVRASLSRNENFRMNNVRAVLGYVAWLAVVLVVPFWLFDNPVLAGVVAIVGACLLFIVAGLHGMGHTVARLLRR